MDATGWGLYVLLHGLLSLALLPILGWSRRLQGRVSPGGTAFVAGAVVLAGAVVPTAGVGAPDGVPP